MKPIDAKQEIDRIVAFLQTTFIKTGFHDAVLGLSGGVDSAVACALATRALGEEHVYPILLPYGALNTQGVLHAMELIQTLGIPLAHVIRIDIQHAVDTIVKTDPFMDAIRKGNIMARVRMIHIFDQAKKRHALVMGTENKSEYTLGYFTRFGDEASDVEPLIHLYKTDVYELAAHLNIPTSIREKPPSAELWPQQTDEKELGFSYEEADKILSNSPKDAHGKNGEGETNFLQELEKKVLHQKQINTYKHKLPVSMVR